MLQPCPLKSGNCANCMYSCTDCKHLHYVEEDDLVQAIAKKHNIRVRDIPRVTRESIQRIKMVLVLDEYFNWLRSNSKGKVTPEAVALLNTVLNSKALCATPELKCTPSILVEAVKASNFKEFCKLHQVEFRIEDLLGIDFSTTQRIRMANKPKKGSDTQP